LEAGGRVEVILFVQPARFIMHAVSMSTAVSISTGYRFIDGSFELSVVIGMMVEG
jgi:hypothetical protein